MQFDMASDKVRPQVGLLLADRRPTAWWEVRVQDDGPGLPKSYSPEVQGIGLTNTRARLRQIYGKDGNLEIENCDRGGVVVTLKFSLQ